MLDGETSDYRIVVYTDNPAALGHLPVHLEGLSETVLADWAGPFDFNHRRKIFAIKDALQKFGGRVVFCDADTYFLKHPRKIFARIRPGRTVMHMREGHLNYCHARDVAAFLEHHDLRTIAGHPWKISPDTPMFNSGVIGLHEADMLLLDEVVYLTDQIYPHVRIHTIEQFAFSACFAQYTKLRQSHDIIYHYWPVREAFCKQLSRVFHDSAITSHEEWFRQLLPQRPSQSQRVLNRGTKNFKHRIRIRLSQIAKRAHLFNALKTLVKQLGLL
jgi:hypothetical protein